jgi:hypothetical protein
MTTYVGDFEIHLTVSVAGSAVDRLAAWAASRGVKFAHVVLARGDTASQPMLTVRGSGGLENALCEADVVVEGLDDASFAVVRVKVEYAPYAAGVPRTGGEAERLPGDVYFEHHIKLLLDVEADAASDASTLLAELIAPHRAHVSRNARRVRLDGRMERFVTQRCRGVGDDVAAQRFRGLTDDIVRAGYEILTVEREFVVYDSAPTVDAGWITDEGGLS